MAVVVNVFTAYPRPIGTPFGRTRYVARKRNMPHASRTTIPIKMTTVLVIAVVILGAALLVSVTPSSAQGIPTIDPNLRSTLSAGLTLAAGAPGMPTLTKSPIYAQCRDDARRRCAGHAHIKSPVHTKRGVDTRRRWTSHSRVCRNVGAAYRYGNGEFGPEYRAARVANANAPAGSASYQHP